MSYNYEATKHEQAFKDALKTIIGGYGTLKAAHKDYSEEVKQFNDPAVRRNYSEVFMENARKKAAEKRDDRVKTMVRRMTEALDIVERENNAPRGTIDIDDPKLQNVLNIVNAAGKSLSYENQLAILEKFRGNEGALDFLHGLYESKGYWHAKTAAEMTKRIPAQAIEDMRVMLAYEDHNPADDNTAKVYWTHFRFNDYMTRMGWDGDGTDAMKAMLIEMKRDARTPAENGALAQGITELGELGENASIGARAAIFDRALRALDKAREATAKEEAFNIRSEGKINRYCTEGKLKLTEPTKEEAHDALFKEAPDPKMERFAEVFEESAGRFLDESYRG